jgi:hypothetical protein
MYKWFNPHTPPRLTSTFRSSVLIPRAGPVRSGVADWPIFLTDPALIFTFDMDPDTDPTVYIRSNA